MPRILIPLIIVALGFLIYGVIDVIRTPQSSMRTLNKASWLLVVIVVPIVGTVLWILWGTRGAAKPATLGPAPRGKGPDDDEEFLRSLRIKREQEAREAELRAKEAELRAREAELKRKREQGEDPSQE